MEFITGSVIVGLIVAAIVGVGIGVLSGMLGVGGGTIMVPAFRLGFGLPAIGATATSLFSIVFISISGCITHIRNKTCIIPVGVGAGIAGAFASPVGVYLASISPAWAIMLAAGLVIAYSSYTMFKKAIALPSKKQREAAAAEAAAKAEAEAAAKAEGSEASQVAAASDQAEGIGASGDKAAAGASKVSVKEVEASRDSFRKDRLWLCLPIGLLAGVCSGYVGVGGGFIMVPMFLAFLSVPMRYASGTSLLAILILAIPGVITQMALGNVDYLVSIATIIGAVPGAVLGANLSKRVPERTLRFMFATLLLICAFVLVVNEMVL